MKAFMRLFFIFGVWVMAVVTCSPSLRSANMPPRISCGHLCPDDYHPVCAVDANGLPRTFANRCFVDFAYCQHKKYYVIMREGEC